MASEGFRRTLENLRPTFGAYGVVTGDLASKIRSSSGGEQGMSEPARDRTSPGSAVKAKDDAVTTRAASELVTEHGKTVIADTVVAKIVGMATRETPGVYAMGMGLSRAFGTVREYIPGGKGSSVTQGV